MSVVRLIFYRLGSEANVGAHSAHIILETLLLLRATLKMFPVGCSIPPLKGALELVDVISDTARGYASTPFGSEIARYALVCLPRLSAATASLDHKPRVAELVCDLLEGKIERPLDDTRASASRNPELRIAAVHAAGELLEIPGRTGYKELFLERRLDDTLVNIMTEYDRELADDELPTCFETSRAGPEAAPRWRCLDLSKRTRLHALPTAELLPTLEALGWFVTRGPKPGFLVYHRPRGPSRRYAHRKIEQELDDYGEPSIENPNFFETLDQVRKYLELHGADGVTKTGDIDEAPLTFRREDANEITDCFDPKVWSTEVTSKVDAIDRAHKLGSIFAKLECVLSKLRPKRWIPLQMHLQMALQSGNGVAFKDLLAVLQPGPAHLAMHSLPPRRLKQHLARVLQGVASFLDHSLCGHYHLPRAIELVVNDIAMIISARAPESRPLLKLWVDVAQKAAKGKDPRFSFPTAAATLVASSLRFAKSIGFQGDDDLSSRLITTAGLALRSGRADALAAYEQNDGPKLVAAAEAAGGADKIAATVFSRYLALAAPAGSHVATASPTAVKCADCSVTDGLCEYAGSKGESFHLCPGCYRYRVTENPAAKFKRVSGAPEAEDRKVGWLGKLTAGGIATARSTAGEWDASDIVLQVVRIQIVDAGKKAVTMTLSDGLFWTTAIAHSDCFDRLTKLVEVHALIKVTKYSYADKKDAPLFIRDFDLVAAGPAVGEILGAPTEFGRDETARADAKRRVEDLLDHVRVTGVLCDKFAHYDAAWVERTLDLTASAYYEDLVLQMKHIANKAVNEVCDGPNPTAIKLGVQDVTGEMKRACSAADRVQSSSVSFVPRAGHLRSAKIRSSSACSNGAFGVRRCTVMSPQRSQNVQVLSADQ